MFELFLQKLQPRIILLFLFIFLFQPILVLAQEILIENADTVWDSTLDTVTNDIIDSSEIPPENLIKYAFVSHAESVWNSELSLISSDVIDSSDTQSEKLITWAFVSHADSFSNFNLLGEEWKIPTDKWSFAIITDLHIGFDVPDYDGTGYNDNQAPQENYYLAERLKKIIERINYLKNIYNIKFVTILGDVSDTAEYSEILKTRNVLNNLSIPYIPLIGNHDVWPYTQKPGIDPDNRSKNNQATIANSAIGDGYFEGIFWCSFPTLGESRDECLIKNTNIQKIKQLFGNTWKRQEEEATYAGSPYLQNYNFKYGGINFISLDFVDVERNKKPGCVSFIQKVQDSTEWLNDNLTSKTILFSHFPRRLISDLFADLSQNIYFSFAGHVHNWSTNDNYRSIDLWGSIITESAREEYNDVIRIVQVKNVANPTKADIDYSKIEGIPENQASNNIKRPDPFIDYSPDNPDFENNVSFYIRDEVNGGKISSCEWNFGDGNSTSSSAGNCQVSHKYEPYLAVLCREFNAKAVVKYNDNTQRITNEKIIRVCPNFKLELPSINIVPISIFGEEITYANTPQSVILTKVTSPGKPVGMVNIHFDEATENINLSNLTIDTNLEKQKSILYIPEWPNVIEEEKILFIPYSIEGSVYVCPNATSLEEINPLCPGIAVLKLGETVDGMTLGTTTYDGQEYYIVYGFINGGGEEFGIIEEFIKSLDDYIQSLNREAFRNTPENEKNAFNNKIKEIWLKIDNNEYQGAISKLINDIRAKVDGYVDGDPQNDWIIKSTAQQEICKMTDDLIYYLRSF